MANPNHPSVSNGGLRPIIKWLRFLFYFAILVLFYHTITSFTPIHTSSNETRQQKQQNNVHFDFPWYKTAHPRVTMLGTFSTSHLTTSERHQLERSMVAQARKQAKLAFDRIAPSMNGIPGTPIDTLDSAQEARQRIDCWTQGQWVSASAPKPKTQLIQHIQDPLYSTCDKRFYKTHSPEVLRPETQYEWKPSGGGDNDCSRVLPKPSPPQWCHVLNGRHILLVGDLVQYQLHELFLDSLRDGPTVCFGELNCKDHTLCSNVDTRLRYLRNDILADNRKHVNNNGIMSGSIVAWPFVPSNVLKMYSILILNRSPVVEDDDTFINSLISTLAYIRRTVPDILIIYRSSGIGHPFCDDSDKPLERPLTDDEKRRLPFGWAESERRDAMAREIVEQAGGVFVDLAALVETRPDGHVGGHDCLRYCIPGPLDAWMDVLYQALVILNP
ncbi:unnamed protein product [Absidia cylindrospora]